MEQREADAVLVLITSKAELDKRMHFGHPYLSRQVTDRRWCLRWDGLHWCLLMYAFDG